MSFVIVRVARLFFSLEAHPSGNYEICLLAFLFKRIPKYRAIHFPLLFQLTP